MLLRSRIPPGSWDSHMHVFDKTYPTTAKSRVAKIYTVTDALEFESSVGMHGIVLVQPSGYGHDNTCLLEALKQLGPDQARGIVTFDPAVTPASTLQEWHRLGVRGIRINLQSVEWAPTEEELTGVLERYALAARPLDWVIQVYAPLATIPVLERIAPRLHDVRLCIDHIGHPTLDEDGPAQRYSMTHDPYDLAGFSALVRLLQGGRTWVKMSAAYRFTRRAEDYEDVAPIAREVLRVAGKDRVVFATDWPHARYEGLDISPWMEKVLEWCQGDEKLIERIFRDNAKELWDIA